ncbi:MAG: radical SAM family heme chaperone HemW [Syntrophobacteraceae bacterium]
MNKEEHPGLYIHVPFCRSKCLYCDFYSVASHARIPAWLEALKKEVLLYKDRFHKFDSLYIGGGTPTILDEPQLGSLLEWLHIHFSFSAGAEMTMEANPDGLSRDKLKAVKDLGINRISLGVQSLDDRDLKYLGRAHTSQQALEALEAIRSCGFSNIGADLIYGLETQSIQGWRRTLERILEFGPQHLSCYQLTLETGTPLWKMEAAGKIRSIGEKLESAFFVFTSRFLEKQGFLHYEISNFAANPEFMSRHNRKYWRHVPYLGLGPSAHSFDAGSRWWNVRSVEKYCELLSAGKSPAADAEVLTREQLDLEALGLGFRTSDGVSIRGHEGFTKMGKALDDLQKSGLAIVNNGRLRPTRKGFLVADSIPMMFCS